MARYQENRTPLQPFVGTAEETGEGISVSGLVRLKNCGAISPYGIYARPCRGDRVGAIPMEGYGYLYLGQVQDLTGLKEGEIRLISKGGAEIRLLENGEISLNGLMITKDGKWKENSSG